MNKTLVISRSQLARATQVLERLRREFSPDFLGIVTMSGQAVHLTAAGGVVDTDAIASLAASAFGATRQLARLMDSAGFTVMFHEGSELNVHIAQISHNLLLVVAFPPSAEIGKVRLLAGKAAEALTEIMTTQGD